MSFQKDLADLKGLTALKIALIYGVVGASWILFSDYLLDLLVDDHTLFAQFQTYKGWFFILVTGLLLFWLVRRSRQEIQRSHQALGESRRSLITLIGNLPGMAYRCKNDPQWTMEMISEGCRDLTGYAPDELLLNRTASFADLIHLDDREPVWDEVQESLEEDRPFQLTYRIRTAEGFEKWVWEQGCGIYADSGELLALEGFITDITERVRAQERERELRLEVERMAIRTATMLSRTIEERDQQMAGHCTRLARYSVELGEMFMLPEAKLEQLRYAALLHDIGKVRVSEAVLNKPGSLSNEEWREMRAHVQVGADLVASINKLSHAAKIIKQHHERWDGRGYPSGLRGEDILLEARILSVVDSYDAMISNRPYRKALSHDEALGELKKHAGSQWDPHVVEKFQRAMSKTLVS